MMDYFPVILIGIALTIAYAARTVTR